MAVCESGRKEGMKRVSKEKGEGLVKTVIAKRLARKRIMTGWTTLCESGRKEYIKRVGEEEREGRMKTARQEEKGDEVL